MTKTNDFLYLFKEGLKSTNPLLELNTIFNDSSIAVEFPIFWKKLQSYAEQHTPFQKKQSTVYKAFFQGNPPLTLAGWTLYLQAEQCLHGQPTDTFKKQCLLFWSTQTLSPERQSAFLKTEVLENFLCEAHFQRAQHLFFSLNFTLLNGLLKHMAIEKDHPLKQALFFIQNKTLPAEFSSPYLLFAGVQIYFNKGEYLEAQKLWTLFCQSPMPLALSSHDIVALRKCAARLLRQVNAKAIMYRNHNQESKAQELFTHVLGMNMPGNKVTAEITWFYAFALGVGLKQIDEAKKALYSLLKRPASLREKTRAWFWIGYFCEKEGQCPKKAYEQAALEPFFLYGQLALARLGRRLAPIFAQGEPQKGFSQPKEHMFKELLMAENLTKSVLNDILNYVIAHPESSPQNTRAFLNAIKNRFPIDVCFYARRLAGLLGARATCEEAYPIFPLPSEPKSYDEAMVQSIILIETSHNPSVRGHPHKEFGLMQIMLNEAKEWAAEGGFVHDEALIGDVTHGLKLGIIESNNKLEQCAGELVLTFCAYNAGLSRLYTWVEKYSAPTFDLENTLIFIESIPFPQTRLYVHLVLSHYFIYMHTITGKPVCPEFIFKTLTFPKIDYRKLSRLEKKKILEQKKK